MKTATVAIIILLTLVGFAQPIAQQGVPQEVLDTTDISAPGWEAVTAVARFAPGSTTGRHTHPGEMVGYVLTGSVILEQDGAPSRVIAAGESVVVPAGVPHTHSNNEASDARMFVTYIVPKGQPIRTNVP